eukprot:TRINITY_DN14373_c0_g1_i1.p1 TRINITY_DN14373_c0_g1~~TRINITY_DN14373_c0_g1_i1.p1  ORF type:complete len:412 (+),score=38.57 TRINITY_DN14373_c0_g1_i1:84-1319(+)
MAQPQRPQRSEAAERLLQSTLRVISQFPGSPNAASRSQEQSIPPLTGLCHMCGRTQARLEFVDGSQDVCCAECGSHFVEVERPEQQAARQAAPTAAANAAPGPLRPGRVDQIPRQGPPYGGIFGPRAHPDPDYYLRPGAGSAARRSGPIEAMLPRPFPAPAADQTGQAAPGQARHIDVVCDGCNTTNFTGTRWRCRSCLDYDLCDRCHADRAHVHPIHSEFEEIRSPRPPRHMWDPRQILGSTLPTLNPDTVWAWLELNIEEGMEARSGLEDTSVAWWLGEDPRRVDVEKLHEQEPDWTCAICSEGVEAEEQYGWIVKICDTDRTPPATSSTTPPATSSATPPAASSTEAAGVDGHIFHEMCLRRWLMKKNACPICRRHPVIPQAEEGGGGRQSGRTGWRYLFPNAEPAQF